MKFEGALHKMQVSLADPVHYQLNLAGSTVELHEHLGKRLRLTSWQAIHGRHCGRKTSKSFSQGYCYPCFRSLAQCDICIVSPEKCHYDQGTCREPEWGEDHCLQDHYIYLSNTSGVKVGITRHTQLPTRWIDQGAVQALAILKVSKRYYSVLIGGAIIHKTHADLAADVGSSREVVSRILRDMAQRELLVSSRGSIEIINAKAVIELSKQ